MFPQSGYIKGSEQDLAFRGELHILSRFKTAAELREGVKPDEVAQMQPWEFNAFKEYRDYLRQKEAFEGQQSKAKANPKSLDPNPEVKKVGEPPSTACSDSPVVKGAPSAKAKTVTASEEPYLERVGPCLQDGKSIRVDVAAEFGSSFDPNRSAYDGSVSVPVVPGRCECALPARVPAAHRDLILTYQGKSIPCRLTDVGPHNTTDDYWMRDDCKPDVPPRGTIQKIFNKAGKLLKVRSHNGAALDMTRHCYTLMGFDNTNAGMRSARDVQWRFAAPGEKVVYDVDPTDVPPKPKAKPKAKAPAKPATQSTKRKK